MPQINTPLSHNSYLVLPTKAQFDAPLIPPPTSPIAVDAAKWVSAGASKPATQGRPKTSLGIAVKKDGPKKGVRLLFRKRGQAENQNDPFFTDSTGGKAVARPAAVGLGLVSLWDGGVAGDLVVLQHAGQQLPGCGGCH